MNPPIERESPWLMRAMFHTVAPRYDFITRAFSYGMDSHWKRKAIDKFDLPSDARVLDLACGTGDFSFLIRGRYPASRPIAADITERMLGLVRTRGLDDAVCSDAFRLPFADNSFDAVFVGYGLRNFPDLKGSVEEIRRVTRPGGVLVSLDFFLPANPLLRFAYLAYLYAQGTFWGFVLHGSPRVYTYIPDSLRAFVSIGEFSELLHGTGYTRVHEQSYILGGIGLHWAAKP
jgi:demethylmenaquinone methyltransferase / 2-methoxy-6-polyprenyl-1,4-benzoquinol methylase